MRKQRNRVFVVNSQESGVPLANVSPSRTILRSIEAILSMADLAERAEPAPVGEGLTIDQQAKLARAVMRKQLALSIRVGMVFFILIFGLPVFNWLMPQAANRRIGGFTFTWLFLGVLFYPLTWLLSGYFIRESDRLEVEIAAEHSGSARRKESR